MSSSAQKGGYYKARTKKWLEAQGYAVVHMEKVYWIQTPKGRIATKRDQWACDLQGMRRSDGFVFVQVKFGSPSQPKTVQKFREYPWPMSPLVKLWLVVWKLRAREPQVIDVTEQVVSL